MPRFKLIVEYDGRPFSGWQRQAGHPSVQQTVEEAIEDFVGKAVRLHCAGRTDAGVHATHQVAHVDLEKPWRADTVRDAVNAYLRERAPDRETRVSILAAFSVPDTFDARLTAVRRHYWYRILNRRPPPGLDAGRVWHVPRPLDERLMAEAGQTLIGHHDFTTFRASQCQAPSPFKTLERLDVERHGEEVYVYASARSFLHHQVRSMVGTIAQAGLNRWSVDEVRAALEAKDRTQCGPQAPAEGLYLIGVDYNGSDQPSNH